MNSPPFRYLAISDRTVCPDPIPRRVRRLLKMGVPAVQLRDKTLEDRTRFEWIQSLRADSDRLLVNSRADLAALGGLAGVHRAQHALPVPVLRSVMGEGLVGVSTHSLPEARDAEARGADYVTFGPVFPTPGKTRSGPGLEGLERVCRKLEIPVLALGGVDPSRVSACLEAGARGAAGIRALFAPPDPEPAWSRIRDRLDV